MAADLDRLEPSNYTWGLAQTYGDAPVATDAPGLVAYWKFDEGGGFTVKDVTGHGHDLRIQEEPRWEVWSSQRGRGFWALLARGLVFLQDCVLLF
jgi:hypothetical protein